MLGFFTDPLPDEILYSAAARYHERAKNKKTSLTMRDLFGDDAYKVFVDLPSHLDNLIMRLPSEHLYTADLLIDKHTLFPFYAPFLPAERSLKIRECMRSADKGGHIYPLSGLLTSKVYLEGLRYCPLCAKEDRETYGEAYWHRIHQIPGVIACAEHQLFLNKGCSHPRHIENRNEHFITAEQVINLSLIRPLNLASADDNVHFRIACDIKWLSENDIRDANVYSFDSRYRYVLFNSAMATFGGSISLTKIKQRFAKTYSQELLNEVSSDVTRECTWIDRLFNSRNTGQHPVRHLLFIQFTNHSLESFLKLPTEVNPFGNSPFPCLNPVAAHFQEPIVEKIVITNKQKSDSEISGTFYCECGFVYRRFGRDEKSKRRFSFDRIVQFGKVWDEALKQAFDDGEPNLEEMAKKFGIVERTLLRQIARLCLTNRYDSLKPKKLGKARMSFAEIEAKRVSYREEWLTIRAENSHLYRSKLRWVKEPIYSWLYKNDRNWLDQNVPEIKTYQYSKQIVDWEARDAEAAPKVKELAAELKSLDGRPIFVSTTILYRRLKITNLMQRPQFIPKTMKALETYGESFEDYALRRIEWGIQECIEKNRIPGRFAFMKMTGLAPKCLANHPLVNSKFNEALGKIGSI